MSKVIDIVSWRSRNLVSRDHARRPKHPRRPQTILSCLSALALIAAIVFGVSNLRSFERAGDNSTATYPASRFRVIDGDTIALGLERIRVENIDTPETGPRAGCQIEREFAARATQHAQLAFERSDSVDILRTGTDRYGRTLARVRLDGRDFGQMMVVTGMAVQWAGHQHEWCG